jgi:hypothetical protein
MNLLRSEKAQRVRRRVGSEWQSSLACLADGALVPATLVLKLCSQPEWPEMARDGWTQPGIARL